MNHRRRGEDDADRELEAELRAAFAAASVVASRGTAWSELRRRAVRPSPRYGVVLVSAAAAAAAVLGAAWAVDVARPDPAPVATAVPEVPSLPRQPTPAPTPPGPGTVLRTVDVDGVTTGVSTGLGYVWVSVPSDSGSRVVRIDPRDGSTRETSFVWAVQEGPAVSADRVWFHLGAEVVGLDPETLDVTVRSPVGGGSGVGASGDRVWAVDGEDGLLRVDPASGEVLARVALPSPARLVHVLPDGAVVATLPEVGAVVRVSADGVDGDPVVLGGSPGALVEGDGLVWVALRDDDELVGLHPADLREVRRLPVPGTDDGDPYPAWDPGRGTFWVATSGGTLAEVDPDDGLVLTHLRLAETRYTGQPAYLDGSVWAVTSDGTAVEVDTDG